MRAALLPSRVRRRETAVIALGGLATGIAGITYAGMLGAPLGLALLLVCMLLGFITLFRARRVVSRQAEVRMLALEVGGDGTWDYDVRTGSIAYDDRCSTMLGYPRGHIADRMSAWGKLVHPDDIGRAREALDEYLAGRADDYEVEVRMKNARGGYCRIIDRGRVVERDGAGRPVRMVGIHRLVEGTPVGVLRPAGPRSSRVVGLHRAAPRPEPRPRARPSSSERAVTAALRVFRVGTGTVDPRAERLLAARALLELVGGSVVTSSTAVDLALPE